jgi:hypothetical protein
MKTYNYIQEELRTEAPSIANIDNSQVYSVPTDFFANLLVEIINKIREGQEPQYSFSNSMPFFVPDGYFENLSRNVLNKVRSEKVKEDPVFDEMQGISPLLNTISKKPVFEVPKEYFKQISFTAPVEKKEAAKVASIVTRRSKVVSYAIAAVIATILAIGVFLIIGKDYNSSITKTNKSTPVNNLTNEEIVNFLKTTAPAEDISSAKSKGPTNDIIKSVSQMSDQEIKEFLQETGEADEI